MSISGGRILSQEAYAQGKMLDHSSWRLARGITPSDIDWTVDSNGFVLFAEFQRGVASFSGMSIGQRRMYSSLLNRQGCAVAICGHNVPASRAIDTMNDVSSLEFHYEPARVAYREVEDAAVAQAMWQGLVQQWSVNAGVIVREMSLHGTEGLMRFALPSATVTVSGGEFKETLFDLDGEPETVLQQAFRHS